MGPFSRMKFRLKDLPKLDLVDISDRTKVPLSPPAGAGAPAFQTSGSGPEPEPEAGGRSRSRRSYNIYYVTYMGMGSQVWVSSFWAVMRGTLKYIYAKALLETISVTMKYFLRQMLFCFL